MTTGGLSLSSFGAHGLTHGLTITPVFDPVLTGSRASPGTAFAGNSTLANNFFNSVDTAVTTLQNLFCVSRSISLSIEMNYNNVIWNGSNVGAPGGAGQSVSGYYFSNSASGAFGF